MKPLQIMRAVLNALQQPTLFSKGVAMRRRSLPNAAAAPPSMGAFRRHHEAVFVDASGHLNLAAHLSRSALAEVSTVFGVVNADASGHLNEPRGKPQQKRSY